MDRLPALKRRAALAGAAVLATLACGQQAPPGPSRFDAVRAVPTSAQATARWCDAFFAGETGPALPVPALEPVRPGDPLPRPVPGRWLWVNVWATWCVPCRREMPLLQQWRAELVREGVPLDLWFISVDDDARGLAAFADSSPDLAGAAVARLDGIAALGRWVKPALGFVPDTIPVHILVTPEGHVRCGRAGSVGTADWATVQGLLR